MTGRVPGRGVKERASVLLSLAASDHAIGRRTMIVELSEGPNDSEDLAYRALEAVRRTAPLVHGTYLSTPDACALAQAMLENGEVE